MRPLNVLVVDDSLITVTKLTRLLSELGHQVVKTAASGTEALPAYQECQPDLVTMDITMPDMDGVEATRQIMSQHPKAVIIMVTSHGQEQMVVTAIKAGARGYVLKPVDRERLRGAIEKAIVRPA